VRDRDDALRSVLGRSPPASEAEFALALEVAMRERGESGTASTRSWSGPNGAKPQPRPGARTIEHGELVVIDFGCIVDGYCSDIDAAP